MKKLSLKQFDLSGAEVLGREEMKMVTGGIHPSPIGGGGCSITCRHDTELCGTLSVASCTDQLGQCRAQWSDATSASCAC